MMVWMRVEVGWRANGRERQGLDLTEVWNRVRMEEGEGRRPEEIGEKEEQIKRVLISI